MRNLLKMFLVLMTVALLFGCADKADDAADDTDAATEEAAE